MPVLLLRDAGEDGRSRRRDAWVGDRLRRGVATLLAVLLLAVGCGPSGPVTGVVDWRGLELTTPEGWAAYEVRDTLLYLADGEPGEEPGDPGTLEVAAQLTYEPGTIPDDWRALIADEGGTIEADVRTEIDGLPARRIVFSWASNGTPSREMVVLVPSRSLVMLFQPVPVQGQTDAPEVFLDRAEEFDAILASIRFGAPVDGP